MQAAAASIPRSGNAAWNALSSVAPRAETLLPLAFLVRLEDARAMLCGGQPREAIRDKHGAIVLRTAIEWNAGTAIREWPR